MPFGQLVIGSPGSGKTTYCHGMYQFLTALKRPVQIVNLDPANHNLPYPCEVSIADLITVKDVMKEFGLGPNGAILYCLEFLESNLSWLLDSLEKLTSGKGNENSYVIFDLPGQVELSTNHGSLRRIVERISKEKEGGWRLVAVHLLDASHITDSSRYISLVLLSLRAMLTLELPHVNVLSKVDLLRDGGDLEFNLDFYTEVQDLSYLSNSLSSSSSSSSSSTKLSSKYSKLNEKICELIEDFSLVSFETLAVEDKRSMFRLLRILDKAVGWIYVTGEGMDQEEEQDDEDDEEEDEPDHDRNDYENKGLDLRNQIDLSKLNHPTPSSSAAPETLKARTKSKISKKAAPRGASAETLFSTVDRGDPLGWGSALEVQERYVDYKDEFDEVERKEKEKERELELERRIFQEGGKVIREEKDKKERERKEKEKEKLS